MSPTRAQAWFALLVLFGINTMNFFDRQILPAVQEKLKAEWELTDRELGWLGTAFIVLYAVVGLPLGRLADVWRRKWILALGCTLWSVLTAASGLAWNFWSLFWLRLGVGVGEASCAPAANSLIGDLFPPQKRARAIGLFMAGLPLGLALSLIVGGIVAEKVRWQAAFYIAGLPGLLLAVAVLFMKDPRRGSADATSLAATTEPAAPGPDHHLAFMAVVRRVLSLPTMWWIIVSGALHNFNMYALGIFISSLFERYHQVSTATAGVISGVVYGVSGVGLFIAGWLGDFAYHRRVNGRLQISWIALALAVPLLLLALQVPMGRAFACAAWFLPACVMLYAYYGTVYAAIQDIIEPKLRGMAMAIYFCAMYLGGAVWGPVATGALSDYLARHAAELDGVTYTISETGRAVIPGFYRAVGLHQAMYIVPILCTLLVVVLFAASRTVTRDRERLLQRIAAEHS